MGKRKDRMKRRQKTPKKNTNCSKKSSSRYLQDKRTSVVLEGRYKIFTKDR